MRSIKSEIQSLIEENEFETAFNLGEKRLAETLNDNDAIDALCLLTDKLRSMCMDLAAKKRDSGSNYRSLEDLLLKANELTNQDMYGGFK
ncbi:hypothetical protein AMS57_01090 [Pseudoalteromonas undina]|uniref:hypothetical protein n=1 Tax=Pseudoalteromonas undina TaxID=43660 RepID=UPI0006BB053F|nr:hypothetical protein [Pseudoalteromonas undina]KPH92155.1 hypothetical protein AMS57_01090 [Pseudoalteromonas undina]